MENTTRSTVVVVDHVSTKKLHPLYAQYDGQCTAQPSYVELDLDSGNLGADYSSAIGGGVPIRVWEGDVVRYDVDPHLTASEINDLLDEIAPIAQEWIDARQGDGLDSDTISYVIDAEFKIQQLCEGRVTESGGVWDAQTWVEADGSNPPLSKLSDIDEIELNLVTLAVRQGSKKLRHDSTDADLDKIAKTLRGIAEDDGLITLENLDEYLIDQRDMLQREKED